MLKFIKDTRGATSIEYGLIATLIGVAIIGALGNLGQSTTGAFQNVTDEWEANRP